MGERLLERPVAGHLLHELTRDLAGEPHLAPSQIRRFLVLPKELDADDGELTRTRKVRRRFIAEKYEGLVEALYSGARHCQVETQVTFEDGRTGKVSATLKIMDARTFDPVKVAA